jgi:F0F1-type ATP synthase assembly protein I
MLQGAIKALLSGLIIALAAESARRSAVLGALIVSLPLVALLSMVWLWRETHNLPRIATQAQATFWYVLPSLPMFLLMPWLWRHGVGFWPGLLLGCALTVALYIAMTALLARAGLSI